MKKQKKDFEKEVELLRDEISTEELLVLGFLKGFTRSDLKVMLNNPVFK